MTFRQIFISTILIFTSLTIFGQGNKKTFLFPKCDTLEYSKHDVTLSTDLNCSNNQITDWLNKNSSGKILSDSAVFYFVFDNKKGVCCKEFTVKDSTKANMKDMVALILKLAEYPEFKQLAKRSSKSKILGGEVSYDKTKNEYRIKLVPVYE